MTQLVSLRQVSKQYGTDDIPALSAIDLEISQGEFIAILGPSGSGKSTLLNILGLLERPSSGLVEIDGRDISTLGPADRDRLRGAEIGFIFQDSHVLSQDSVARNVALGLRVRGVRRTDQALKVETILDDIGILRLWSRPAGLLSGGERQRTAIARAMAGRPSLILADEPTGNLDSANATAILDLLRAACMRDGSTVIVVTHSEELASHADRIIRIRDGALESDTRITHRAMVSFTRTPFPSSRAVGLAEMVGSAISSQLLSPLRMTIIVLAFAFAIGGLVAAVGVGTSGAQQVSSKLSAAALDQITVRFGSIKSPSEMRRFVSVLSHLSGVRSAGAREVVSSASGSAARLLGSVSVEVDQPMIVASPGYLAVSEAVVSPESARSLFSSCSGGAVAIVGSSAARSLGIGVAQLGSSLEVASQQVTVIGLLNSAPRDQALTNEILISTCQFSVPKDSQQSVVLRTQPGMPAALAPEIPAALEPATESNVRIETVADLRALAKGVDSSLGRTLLVSALVLMVLATLTSTATMLLSVSARTKEIALRRAVGESRLQIASSFVLEGVFLGFSGSLAGLALGIVCVVVICASLRWSVDYNPALSSGCLLAGILIGAASAAVPARAASRIQPAQALRS